MSVDDHFRMPEPRYYSHQDLNPHKLDPRCSPDFPLGNFWPVYLGNFWCDHYAEHATKVQEYFASKGLLVRMVFGRNESDDPFFKHQHSVHLYDFLVYFVREEDAEDAINCCHREMHYGHRLNVFPGRVSLYFDLTRSVKHVKTKHIKPAVTEQVFETCLLYKYPVQVACIVQHTSRDLLVEYVSVEDRDRAIRCCQFCMPLPIEASQEKQRFTETNVQQEIYERCQRDPSFATMVPRDDILAGLFNGIRYSSFTWRNVNRLQIPEKIPTWYRLKFHETLFKSAYSNFGVKCSCKHHAPGMHVQQERPSGAGSNPAIAPVHHGPRKKGRVARKLKRLQKKQKKKNKKANQAVPTDE